MDETMRHARKNVIRGAVLLWIVSPLLIGGGIAVTTHLVNDGRKGALLVVGAIVWAVVSLVVLLGGFASLLLGVFLWWRSRNPAQVVHTSSPSADRAEVLRDLRSQPRGQAPAEDALGGASDSVESSGRR